MLVAVEGGRATVREGDGPPLHELPVADLRIEPALGGTDRAIVLPGGQRCVTRNLAAVARLERGHGRNRGMRLVHRLEAQWAAALACLVALAAGTWLFVTDGIPFLAARVAERLPPSAEAIFGDRTLEVLDKRFLAPSELEPGRAGEVSAAFEEVRRDVGAGPVRLELRRGRALGPNAFALPPATVVVTDELIELAPGERELSGVLAHELAHLGLRHGLRSVLQSAGVYVLVTALTGDVTAITSLAGSLPTVLAESGYSRSFEREADEAAARHALGKGWGVGPYTAMLRALAEKHPDQPALSYLSTHPLTAERIAEVERLGADAGP